MLEYYDGESERCRVVREFFDGTASSYEWIIGFMSFWTGDWYRYESLRRAGLRPGMRVLDVACGTGTLSRQAERLCGSPSHVIGLDPSVGMLREYRARALGPHPPIPLVQGVAEALPFADCSFDFLSMGYALRHVSDLTVTLAECVRVLRVGGRLAILDFARPRGRSAYVLIQLFLDKIVPLAARLHSRTRLAQKMMRYCWATVDNGIPQALIVAAIERAGFEDIRTKHQYGFLQAYTARKFSRSRQSVS